MMDQDELIYWLDLLEAYMSYEEAWFNYCCLLIRDTNTATG